MIKFSFSKSVAIFIDGDNQNWIDYAQQILKVCDYIGLVYDRCYAYGDWNKFKVSKQKKIDDLKIDRIQVNSRLKNATDNRILIDIGKSLVNEEDWIGIYVIVSSDGDFASLCQPILEEGREVICIGKKGRTSKALQELAIVYYFEDLDKHLSELESHYVIPLDILRKFKTQLSYVYSFGFGLHNEDWISYTQMEEKMREDLADGEYDFYFGKYDLSQLIGYCSDYFEIEEERIKSIDHNPEATRRFWLRQAYNKNRNPPGTYYEHVSIADKLVMIGEPVNMGKLQKSLREIDKNYENHFGSKNILYWLRQDPNYFKVDKNDVVMYIWGKSSP